MNRFYNFISSPLGIFIIFAGVGLLILLIIALSGKKKDEKFNLTKNLEDKNKQLDTTINDTTKEINETYDLNVDGVGLKNQIAESICIKPIPCDNGWIIDPSNPECCKIAEGKKSFMEKYETGIVLARDYAVGEAFEKTMKSFVPSLLNKAAGKTTGMMVSDKVTKKVSRELTESISKKVGKEVSEEVVEGLVKQKLGQKVSEEVGQKITKELGEKIAGKIGKEITAEILEKVIKEVLEKVVKSIVKKIALKIALFFVKLAKNMALGPIGVILTALDILSMALDIFDPLGFENYVSQGDFIDFRNIILYASIKSEQEAGRKYPTLWPVLLDPQYMDLFVEANEAYLLSREDLILPLFSPGSELYDKYIAPGVVDFYEEDILDFIENNPEVDAEVQYLIEQYASLDIKSRDEFIIDMVNKRYPGKFELYSSFSTPQMPGISFSKKAADEFLSWENKKQLDDLIQCFGMDCFYINDAAIIDRDDKYLSEDELTKKTSMIYKVSPPIYTDKYFTVDVSNPGTADKPNLIQKKLSSPAPLFFPMVGMLIDMCEGTTWARSQIGNLVNFVDTMGEKGKAKFMEGLDFVTPEEFDDFMSDLSKISGASDAHAELNEFREKNQITDDDIDEDIRRTLNFQTGPKFSLGDNYGNEFDKDTFLCKYTSKYCRDMGLGPHTPSSGIPSCKMYKGQAVAEMIFGKTITRSFIITANELADEVKKAAKATEKAFKDAISGTKKGLKVAGKEIKDFTEDVIYEKGLKVAGKEIKDFTEDVIYEKGLKVAGEEIKDFTEDVIYEKGLKVAGKELKGFGKDTGKWFKGAGKTLKGFGKGTGSWFKGAGKDTGRFFSGTARAFENWGSGAIDTVGDWSSGAIDDAKDWTSGAVDDAKDWTSGAVDDAGDWISGAGKSFVGIFKSDERLKDNMVLVEYNVNGLGVNLYQFTWNNTAKNLYNLSGDTYGFSAAELLEVYPELVRIDENGYLFIQIPENIKDIKHKRILETLLMIKNMFI